MARCDAVPARELTGPVVSPEDGGSGTKPDQPLWLRLLAFIIALAVLVIGIWLLVDLWEGTPTAAAFTRVGGQTHVETALEASRFWTQPPGWVVAVSAAVTQENIKHPALTRETMMGAAQCAMAHDAPLLFRSRDPKRERVVQATISTLGHPFEVANLGNARQCLRDLSQAERKKLSASTKELSAYGLHGLLSPGPRVAPIRNELAPFVVFAAAWGPGFPPDIAVGLALAAHMAPQYDGGASLVVVPRAYLEADPKLEALLRGQRRVVQGGVVLGSQKILPEDTRALLRQLLTATDRQGFLGEMRTTLGSVEPLVAALLALFALRIMYVTAPRGDDVGELKKWAGKPAIGTRWLYERVNKNERISKRVRQFQEFTMSMIRGNRSGRQATVASWLSHLDGDQNQPVTIQLVTGRAVTGTITPPPDAHARTATVMRVNVKDPQDSRTDHYVLLLAEDIESIRVPPEPSPPAGESAPKAGETTSPSPEDPEKETGTQPPLRLRV